MRRTLALALTGLTTAGLAAVVPAANADSVPVTATVGVSTSLLSVATLPVALSGSGSSLTSTPAATVVTDTRVTPGLGWTLKVSASDLTLVGAVTPSAATTIPAGDLSMTTSTPLVTVPGTATVTDTHTSTPLALTNADQTLMSATTANANVVSFIPTYTLTVPGGVTAGAYAGTLTETVS